MGYAPLAARFVYSQAFMHIAAAGFTRNPENARTRVSMRAQCSRTTCSVISAVFFVFLLLTFNTLESASHRVRRLSNPVQSARDAQVKPKSEDTRVEL